MHNYKTFNHTFTSKGKRSKFKNKKSRVNRSKNIPMAITFDQSYPVNEFYNRNKEQLKVNVELEDWKKFHPDYRKK